MMNTIQFRDKDDKCLATKDYSFLVVPHIGTDVYFDLKRYFVTDVRVAYKKDRQFVIVNVEEINELD